MLLWFALISIVIGLLPAHSAGQADELEKMVRRLKLKNLEATLVENQLKQTIDPDQQNLLRQRLARLYVEQLENLIEQPEQFKRVAERLKDLEADVAELREPKIVFARLDAQFRHGEYLLSQYRENRRQNYLLVDISRLFTQLLEEFQSLESASEDRIEALNSVDAGAGSIENRRADEEIEELSEISFRSAFYRGWSAFHAGLSKQSRKLGRPFFEQALQAFGSFLDINIGDDVENWDEGFLDLASLRNSQAFFGVALAFLAIGNNSDADFCFELLRSEQAVETVKSQIALWQVQTLLELRQLKDGEELAKAYLDSADQLSDLQRGQIALMLVRIAYQDPKNHLTQLGFLGIKVLAQLRQFALIQRLMEQNSIVLPDANFYSEWIRGQLGYQKAEKAGGVTEFLAAAKHLQAAVLMDKEIPVADLEYCRYQLGWAYYRGAEYDKAAKCLELVVPAIARFEPEIAATACWLQHDCYLQQDESDPASIRKALASLDNLVNRFPGSSLAKRARLQMVKLQRSEMGSDQALQRLRDAVSSAPEDSSSRFELCLASYRKYLELINKKENPDSVKKEILQLVHKLQEATDKLTLPQQLKLILIQLDIQFRTDPRSFETLEKLVSQAVPLTTKVENTNLIAETHYRQYQIAREKGNDPEEQRHVAWLVENGDGTVYQKSVLVRRVQQVEQELAKVTEGESRNRLVTQAIDVYQKLARSIGFHVQGVSTSKNAQVAVSRLSELMEETGDWKGAERSLEILTEAFPKKVVYLQRYARILIRNKKFESALDYWRRLASGLKKESDDWYEAKYSVIRCLVETDPAKAKPPLVQFLNLYDPPANWKPEFSELATRLGIR